MAAAALRSMGGHIQGRLLFRNDEERERATRAGIDDFDRKYEIEDMVRADVIFAATGVTDGSIVRGARRIGDRLETETILMRSATGSVRRIQYSRRLS